jgi:PAS domain S-box-containing protein
MDFRVLADNSTDAVSIFDGCMKCLYVNPAMEKATGIHARDFIGKKLQETRISKDACTYLEDKIRQVFITGNDTEHEIQMKLFDEKDSKIWLWRLIPEKSPDQKILTVFLVGRDITVKKQLINANSLTINRFYALFENTVDIIFETDRNGTITYISHHVRKYGFREEDLISTNILEIVIPEDREHAAREYLKVQQHGRISPVIIRTKDKKGKICWFESRCSRQKDADGTFVGISGILKDITEQKTTEERLLKINQCLLEFTADPFENIDRLTARSAQLLGADHAYYERIDENDLSNRKKTENGRNRKNEGSQIHIVKAIKMGKKHIGSLFLAFPADHSLSIKEEWLLNTIITAIASEEKRRIALESLMKSESKYKIIFENSPIGIFYMDPTGKIIHCNDELARIIGSPKKFIEGLNIKNILMRNPATAKVLESILHGVPLKYEGDYISLYSGKITPIEAFLSRHITEDGKILGSICTVQDTSERKEKEQVISILEAVSQAASKFLQIGLSLENFNEILEKLGKATDVSRIYVFQNEVNEDGTFLMNQKYEWVAQGVAPQIDNPVLQGLPYRDVAPRWEKVMKRRYHIAGNITDFPDEEREILGGQGILSLAAVPIYVGKEWWGFIGFDDCKHERDWSMVEMDALWAAADTMGAAILRQQNEAEIQNSQKRLQTILEAVQTGVIIIDAQSHTIVDVNPVAMKLIGRSKEEIIGRVCYDFICQTEKGKCPLTDLKQVLDSSERILLTAKGKEIPILKSAAYIELEGKQHIVESFFDIFHIKEAEKALRESEERYRDLFENSSDLIQSISADGSFVYVNRAWRETLGYTEEEVAHLTLNDVLHPSTKSQCMEKLKRIIGNDNPGTIETIFITKDDREVVLEGNMNCKHDNGNVVACRCMLRDITERKKTEEELRESEEKFKTLFMNANDAIYIYDDICGKIKEVNDVTSEMLGYSREELLNMSPRDFNSQEYAALLPERLKELKRKGKAIFETIYVDSSGKKIPVEISSRIIDYKGKKAILTIARNITERKIAEESHKKELLLKEIHHRVKNNLQVIASLLNLQSRNFQDKKIRQAFAESQNRVRSMAIAHEKLYMSKDLENINARDYINNLASYLLHSYRIGTGKVGLEIDVDNIYLNIDKIIPLALIINELITNSLKYAFIPGEEGVVRLSFKNDGNLLVITISDNGKGIPENIDIFNTDSLGMQLVTTLVEQLKGKLELDRNAGSRFSITFDGHE